MNSNRKTLLATAHIHGMFGSALVMPLIFFILQDVFVSFSESRASNDNLHDLFEWNEFIPFLLMLPALIALELQMLNKMRVSIAKRSLRLLSCGVSYAAFYIFNRYFGFEASLFAATFVPYLWVRFTGKELLDRDLALTDDEVARTNAD